MTGLRSNDAATVRQLYSDHFPAVRRMVLGNSGTVSDAQDMFQEAMAVLWLSVKEGRLVPDADPGGFLFRVARNKWLDVVRSAAHRHMKVVHDERVLDQRAEPSDDLEERLSRLRDVYEQLDDRCRSVLDRYYFERKDMATIAAELGVGEDSVRTMKYRCMMKLRAMRRTIASGQHNGEA
ncbi:MAG: sigma-70 family RNA polymerase sigma factor [Flavobacteriales bacterium]|nr:sigma-70 family RNA polymerase sigma factor [Flavobacteriales bacterium]